VHQITTKWAASAWPVPEENSSSLPLSEIRRKGCLSSVSPHPLGQLHGPQGCTSSNSPCGDPAKKTRVSMAHVIGAEG
jgi:hypothetical protein